MLKLTTRRKPSELWGIFFLCLLAFVVVSLLSYHPQDPSFNSVSTSKLVHNLAGLVGSYFADIIFQTFGISAFLFLFPLIFLAINSFFPTNIPKKWSRLVGFFLLIVASAALCSLSLKTVVIQDQKLLAGGIMGHMITAFLLPYFSLIGSYIIVLGGVIANIVLSLNMSLGSAFSLTGDLVLKCVSLLLAVRNIPSLFKFRRRAPSPSVEPLEDYEFQDVEEMVSAPPRIREEPIMLDDEFDEAVPDVIEVDAHDEEEIEEADEVEDDDVDEFDEDDENVEEICEPDEAEPPVIMASSPRPAKKKLSQKLFVDYFIPKGNYKLPKISILSNSGDPRIPVDRDTLFENSRKLEEKLKNFHVDGRVVEVRPGPVITVYEFEPAPGIKVSKIVNLSDDLALALSAVSVRIVAPIPGKSVVGIELPNDHQSLVSLKDILQNNEFRSMKFKLPLALGKSISGDSIIADLARMPHLLVAGATGSGKSIFLNSVICSFLFRYTPDQLRFLMIDPKMLELTMYDHIPHLLLPVVTDPKKAALALKWGVQEMDRRYNLMSKLFVRSIDSYNKKIEESSAEELDLLFKDEFSDDDIRPSEKLQKLPYIVIVIDELADLMMVASKEVELSIARLAQMARAAGIHLIVATQRPSVDVLTGLIKANFPARIAFQVSSRIDSRTILDHIGAEKLLGNGDMLYSPPGVSRIKRVHGAFVSDQEVKTIVDFLKKQGAPQYDTTILSKQPADDEADYFDEDDDLYQEAIQVISKCRYASISMIQRRLRIGYNRAARMIEQMEAEGIVGPADGAKPREVLVRS